MWTAYEALLRAIAVRAVYIEDISTWDLELILLVVRFDPFCYVILLGIKIVLQGSNKLKLGA